LARRVLVLNTTYEPINICSIRRAVVLLLKNRADVLETDGPDVRAETISVPRPVVIRLRDYVSVPRSDRRRLSRRVVLARDGHRCQYCGSTRHLTLDHVIPRSRGGATSWDNVVTSCSPCNTRKGDRLPAEIDMVPRMRPRPPRLTDFLTASPNAVPDGWMPYLEYVPAAV
jgi:5-methylcytosine-specific restriction endonuclease McrA